jgi:bifunctional UDP-N-acetylglucosamine pyrophosphorylase/glucosamine-1-phosphate N-acetyltransferase
MQLKQALPYLRKNSISLILYGDVPLVAKTTLKKLINSAAKGNLSLLTFIKEDPTGYGRIMRGSKSSVLKNYRTQRCHNQERT